MRAPSSWGLPVAMSLLLATNATANTGQWWVGGAGQEVVAADCGNCDEEAGIIIICKGSRQPAEVIVYAGASDRGTNGAPAPVTFDIDGETQTYTANTVEFGLVGFTPVMQLAPNDPLIHRLQSGQKATVTFNGQIGTIGLKGSRVALDTFRSQCGWVGAQSAQGQLPVFKDQSSQQATVGNTLTAPVGQLPVFGNRQNGQQQLVQQQPVQQQSIQQQPIQQQMVQQPVQQPSGQLPVFDNQQPSQQQNQQIAPQLVQPQVQQQVVINQDTQPQSAAQPFSQTVLARASVKPDADGLFWFTGDGFGGGSPKTIKYAIPETDAVAITASCERFDQAGINAEIHTSFGNLPSGSQVVVEFSHTAGTSAYSGTTFQENEEYAGTRFTVQKGDPLWQMLAGSQQVTFGIQGQQKASIRGSSGAAALMEFSQLCIK